MVVDATRQRAMIAAVVAANVVVAVAIIVIATERTMLCGLPGIVIAYIYSVIFALRTAFSAIGAVVFVNVTSALTCF